MNGKEDTETGISNEDRNQAAHTHTHTHTIDAGTLDKVTSGIEISLV